jgi:hypothetical protein
MLQTAEQLVADFANASGVASNGDPSANPLDSPLASSLAPGQSLDGIDVELPNGYSAEIYHVDPVGGGGSQGAEDQMVDTMQQLAGYLSTYPATAAEAYTKTAADASSPTANVNSVA